MVANVQSAYWVQIWYLGICFGLSLFFQMFSANHWHDGICLFSARHSEINEYTPLSEMKPLVYFLNEWWDKSSEMVLRTPKHFVGSKHAFCHHIIEIWLRSENLFCPIHLDIVQTGSLSCVNKSPEDTCMCLIWKHDTSGSFSVHFRMFEITWEKNAYYSIVSCSVSLSYCLSPQNNLLTLITWSILLRLLWLNGSII